MASETDWLTKYPKVNQESWLNKYPKVEEKPFFDLSDTLSATGRAFTSLGTSVPASMRQAFGGLENPWQRSEGYAQSRADMQALQQELEASDAAAMAGGDASSVSSSIREATPSLGFSGSTLVPSLAAGAVTALATKSPAAARSAAAGTSLLMAYRMAGAQFLDDSRERIDNFFQEKLQRPLTPEEQNEAYEELLPLARKFGAAEAGPEALGNMALGGAGKYIRKALGGKNGIMSLASNALSKVTGAKAVGAGVGAAAGEVGTEAITAVEQDRINKEFEQSVLRGEAPESVVLPDRTVQDYTQGITDVAPTTLAMTGLMGLAGLGPTAINRGYRALRPQAEQQVVETEIVPEEPATATAPTDGVVTTLPFNREDIRATDLPFNREDIRASELPFTREDIRPTQLPFNREDIRSTELPFSRQNIRGLSQLGQPAISPGLTAAVNTADSIVTTAENTSSDVSQATTAVRNIIQGVVDTPQPQKAPAELQDEPTIAGQIVHTPLFGDRINKLQTGSKLMLIDGSIVDGTVINSFAGELDMSDGGRINTAYVKAFKPKDSNEFIEVMPKKPVSADLVEVEVSDRGGTYYVPKYQWDSNSIVLDQVDPNDITMSKSQIERSKLKEIIRKTEPTKTLNSPVETPSPAMEQPEKPSQTTTDSNGNQTTQNSGGIGGKSSTFPTQEEIQSEGNIQNAQDEAQEVSPVIESVAPKKRGPKSNPAITNLAAQAAAINAGTKALVSSKEFIPQSAAQPPSPQGAVPTPATEGTVMPGGSAIELETDEQKFQRIKSMSPSQRTDEDIAFANAFSKRQKELKPQAGEATRKAFLANHTASIGGRLRKALDQTITFRGLKGTVGSWAETLYNEGWRMALDARGNRQFTNGTEALGSSGLGKVGMNYADFLSSQPQTTTVAAPTETAAPSAKEAAVASVVQQPVEGSIPTVEQESAITAIESTEKTDVADAAIQEVVDESTDLNPITDEMVDSSLSPVEKREAAIILGKKTWNDSKELFKQRMADWMAGANETSKKLIKFFKSVASRARLLLAASIGLSMANSTSDANLAESNQFKAFRIPVSSVLNSKPARPKFGGLPDMNIGIPEQKIPLGAGGINLSARRKIDSKGKSIPADVVKTAQWALDTKDTEGYPFIVTDKVGAAMYFFDENGVLLKKSPVLVGKNVGDFIGNTDAGRITPSGRFEIAPETDATYGNVFSVMGTDMVDSETGDLVEVAIHRLALHDPSENRPQRIATKTPLDNRISWGCLNLDNKVMDWAVRNYPLGGVIYILPETAKGRSAFAPFSESNIESSKLLTKSSNVDRLNELNNKEDKKLQAAQKQREELGLKTLNSLIEKTRTNVVQGTVKSSDANQAVAILNKSGAIPNVLFTWIGTSKDFLADPANRARYPETWKAVSSNPNIEGMSENGQPIVFTDNVGVSDLDRNLAKLQGTTPEVAAVRRVILHENIHKGMFFLSLKDKMKLFQFLHRLYSPEELDQLAKSYDEYSDWRINQVSYFSIIEEAMTRDFDSMAEIPRDGIWAEFMQFLREIWQKITGKTSELKLKDYKDVFRLIRNSLKNSEKVNADRLKNGGAVRMSMSEFISNVTPEQDAAYAKAVADGDMETAQAMVDAAARGAGYNVGPVFHGTNSESFTVFDITKARPRGYSRIGFWFSDNPEAMEAYGRKVITAFIESSEAKTFNSWNSFSAFMERFDSPQDAVEKLKLDGYDSVEIDAGELDGFEQVATVVFNPNQIKSADPVTYDDAGNVIPLSRRFQSASNDIRFSKVEYDSPNEAAFNSGAEVARNSDYDERDKAVRSTIRAAYDLAPKDNGPSVPIDQLFDIAKQSMPDLTEGEFSQILQDLYEDSGALLQASESPFIVTTPDGQRAGSVIIVSSLPTGAMASAIDSEDDATKKFVKDIQGIESGTLKAAFGGRQFFDFEPVEYTVRSNKSYEQTAINYVNNFIAEGGTLEQMANSVIAPNFLAGIGIEDDVMARQALVAEVKNRIVNAGRKKKSKVEKKFFERLNQRISAFWQGVGSKGGRNQGQRAYIIGNPRYSWMFLTDEVDKELKQRRDNILNVQFGNDNATSFTQNSYENADMASTVSADEVAKDTINDTEWDLIKEGEQVFDGVKKTKWERIKSLVRRFAFYARAESAEKKSASKASMTDAEINELNAILTMPKAEREKAKAKDLAEFESLMNDLLGEESPTDTPTEKKKRKKRKEIIDTVEKRVKAGEPIEAPDYIPIITENPQRDEIIDDVANSLLQVAKNRGIKPSQKTALADLVASIKSLLKANIKGKDLKADEAPLGQLLARTYLDNLTATEAKLFAQSWNRGRDKVRKMLAETGLEGAALEAELSAIMPATPTIAYNPSAVRKAITRALREATLDANDLLANPQETKAEILKVWDKAAVDAGLSPENWQEGRKLAEKSINEFIIERKAAKERSKQIAIAVVEQSKNPASLADFSNSLAQFKIKPDKVRELFDQAKLLAKRRVQIANDKSIRLLNEFENKLAKSAFFNSDTKPDTIVKAFREQISDPMDRKAFKDRLMAMEVTLEMADKLFDKAARTKDNAQWKRAQDMLEGPNALRNILREINKARPGDQAPLSKQIPWRKLLSQKAKTVEEYRQRIFDAISANEELKSATPEQKARLADLFTEAWESNRKRILDGMQERLIREKEAKGDLSKKGAEALQEQRMRMVEDINLGIFDNDEIAKIMAEKFGIKSEFTDAEREKIESLIEVLQDEKLNRVKRNKAAYELLETLSAQTDIPISKLLANFWVSSVLSGMNTVFSIGMSVFSGMGELTTALSRIFVAAFSNQKQLPSEVAAAFKTLARVLSAVPRQANRAWQYLVTGDQAFLDPTMNDALKNMDWDSIGKNTQFAEQMAKSDNVLKKSMGLFMRTVSRLLTALDLFNSGLTKEGSLSIVFRQLDLDPSKIEMLEKKSDLKAYKAQVIQDYFGNIAPKTAREKALVDSYAMAEMMKALDELGSVSENADQMAMQGAMTLDPSGIGGYGYRAVKSLMKSAESGADKLVERNLRKWDEAKDASDTIEAGVKLALSYIFQFAAYNAANLVGVRFARFAGNKFNQSLSFLPGLGALRLFEAEFDPDRIRGKEAFTDMIKRNQITGVMAAVIGYYVLKAIAEEPDDEERGWFINGGWSNLTPEKKQQMLASGQKEYTLGFGDTVINYGNWPGSGIIAAIGGLSDLIRFSPEQWSEKTVPNKLMSATTSGVFSALEVPALSQFQELFGSSLSSKDPNEQKLTKFARVIGNYAGGFMPRILKDIDYLADPNLRKYETLWEKTASHIPVYRRYEGKEYYDILGQQIQRNIYPGSREFMQKPTDPVYRILGALNSRGIWLTPANAEHRMVGKGVRRRKLTQEEADNYGLETGKGYKQMLLRYGQRALQMPTERARAFLLDKADDVRDRALKKIYRGYTPAS